MLRPFLVKAAALHSCDTVCYAKRSILSELQAGEAAAMYGMVNQGVRAFIVENFGETDWSEICNAVGLSDHEFEAMATYPDAVTYDLVKTISAKYDMPPERVLEVFGTYWVEYSGQTAVGQLLRFGGNDLLERLDSLNELHERIKLSMPHLKPPSFDFVELEEGLFSLRYWSERDGLETMVIGLVRGLSEQTGQAIELSQDAEPAVQDARASFTIRLVG
ncbi:heme NO-binding domain-containing protein [Oceanicaulis sp. LC35]|uniref:heme NO-binding domain-containing protein n=1 Tax=Oceanicaulis sp. LC35 TaxID=3349635 RepID=UPI003F8401F1